MDKKVTEIEKAAQVYLTTFLTLLSYSIDEAEAEEADDKMREQQRKMKR